MVSVRVLQTISTTTSKHEAGEVILVTEVEAVAWSSRGLVIEVAAVAPAVETAVTRKGKR